MIRELFYLLVFPGLVFAATMGGTLSWFDRKITAWLQFRKGPPFLQPLYDLLKLVLVKETIIPKTGSTMLFLSAPLIGLVGSLAACVLILLPAFGLSSGFQGDLVVIFYLLTMPALSFILGAMASGNPLASVGASREMKLTISYELTFILIIALIAFSSGMTIRIEEIMAYQQENGVLIRNISGVLALIAAIFVIQAKMGMVPFDIAEAETEINHGSFIEYSGAAYGLILLTRYILFFTVSVLLVVLFMGGFQLTLPGIAFGLLKLFGVVLVMVLIKNTNPRLKIGQAMRFFFIGMNLLVLAAFFLNLMGF
jgi:NADH-quinone oxidoreductase subunit H